MGLGVGKTGLGCEKNGVGYEKRWSGMAIKSFILGFFRLFLQFTKFEQVFESIATINKVLIICYNSQSKLRNNDVTASRCCHYLHNELSNHLA